MATRQNSTRSQAKGDESKSPRKSPRTKKGETRRAESAAADYPELLPPSDNLGQLAELCCADLCCADRGAHEGQTPELDSAGTFLHSSRAHSAHAAYRPDPHPDPPLPL